MAESTPEERTEMPTDKRMGELRKEGQLAMSSDLVSVISLLAGFSVLLFLWNLIFHDLKLIMLKSFSLISRREPFVPEDVIAGAYGLARLIAPPLITIVVTVAVISSLAVMLQTGFNVREKKIKFRFNFLNPITGIKRMFSLQSSVNVLKALFKLLLILPIGYFALKAFAPQMVMLVHMSVQDVFAFGGYATRTVFWRVFYVLVAFAIFDYVWTNYQWLKGNKMTKSEVKDEKKAVEGDEETKRRIQLKGLQRIAQRIRQNVPKADVVVTNPTHYAVALKYDRGLMGAPVVVAKGTNFLALRIREIAREHGVPVLERKALARALYSSTEVGSSIPHELFRAVAEVLAYVFRLKRPWTAQRPQPQPHHVP